MQERNMGNYAILSKGYLFLALGVHYIMFRLEKKVKDMSCARYPPTDTESWKNIISAEEWDASYNPSYDRLGEGGPFELKMAMDLFYHPIDAL